MCSLFALMRASSLCSPLALLLAGLLWCPAQASSALVNAARSSDVKAMEKELADGADINYKEPGSGQTPLMAATLAGQLKSVEFLLGKGADTTIAEQDGYTPMHGAGFQGRADVAEALIKHGIEPSEFHADGYAPIHRACWGGEQRHTDTVAVFLKHGVSPKLATQEGEVPVKLTSNPKTKELLVKVIKASAALVKAARSSDIEAMEKELNDGADINYKEPSSGQTPLMAATLAGQLKSVEFLLGKGADTTIGEKDGYTPMHGAGFQGRADVAEALIKHGIEPSGFHSDGYAPIHRACWGGEQRHTDTVAVFLKHGVNPKLATQDGKIPIELAKNPQTKELLAEAKVCKVSDPSECSEKELDYIEKFKGDKDKIVTQLQRLRKMVSEDQQMKPSQRKWLVQRVAILKQLVVRQEL